MPVAVAPQDGYPLWTGMVFVFNLIVGTGALTLPSVFARAGWLLGSLSVLLLAFLSYVTLTFVLEACSLANALQYYRRRLEGPPDSQSEQEDGPRTAAAEGEGDETQPLCAAPASPFALHTQFELGDLATLLLRPVGRVLFYACVCVYLYGDLSIYNAAVAQSLTDVVCGRNGTEAARDAECRWGLGRGAFYRLCLVGFVCALGPFVFGQPARTRPVQLLTGACRWLAFLVMLVLACARFWDGRADGAPPAGDWRQVPGLFGACIYSFMCHHSLPSLVAPVRNKERLRLALGLDYVGVALFYLLLALSGAFAFRHLQDLYTLNFVPEGDAWPLQLLEYFLALFPVFTLAASYPLIGITLRNNLRVLLRDATAALPPPAARALFPLLAVVPPLLVTLCTDSIRGLVRFTGSYAGAGIQYLIPVALVYAARRRVRTVTRSMAPENPFASPFRHGAWLVLVLAWTAVCVGLVTYTFVAG